MLNGLVIFDDYLLNGDLAAAIILTESPFNLLSRY